ncbi:hypothetical protein [Serinibacter arcticus]|uniref:Uncharacterized protein n=1 Tax=Serinibacter arcticus TaxID=1655435 RepID=A0A4Z1E341_9MICO|nr:hypothetical protein [Serinibacter arcticus]TGO05172.1 hypothetical protein SERN_1176 [Serinibacter arcticus]
MRRALLILTVTTLMGLAGVVSAQAQQTDPSQVLLGSGASARSVATRGYDVSASGITLPADSTFTSFSYVTYWVTALDGTMPRAFGVNLLPDDGSVGAQHIGASTLLFDDARAAYPEGYCVTWVEISMFDEKFGESAEDPECTVYPGVGVVSGVSEGVDGIDGAVAIEDGEARTGLSVSGPAPIAGLISVLVIAAAAVLMVRYGSLQD